MLDFVILNTLFILTPLICYLVYIVYENIIGEKGNDLFFALAIITSIYLITKYSIYFNYSTGVLKVLLLICLLKNKKGLSILISIYIITYFYITNGRNLYFLIVEYFTQLSMFIVVLKSFRASTKLIIFTIIAIICDILFQYDNIIVLLIYNICYVLSGFIIYKLLIKSEKLVNIYGTLREIQNEKEFRDSLFKITHEIKNPIAVCKGYLDMLDTVNQNQVNRYVPIIKQEINHTLTLMNDFLNLTKLKIVKNEMDISLLLDDLCTSVDELLHKNNIHFIFDITDDSVIIEGDYDRLKQVLLNIIKNSTESIINENMGIIRLKNIIKNNKIIIKITDNGIGMDKEILKHIGEAFYTTKKNGTGLGIKLSMEIIELHNGKIKYSSKINEGTSVIIELPRKKLTM